MKKYTTAIHIQRVKKVLKRQEPCGCCPAARFFNARRGYLEMWSKTSKPCHICVDFLGLQFSIYTWKRCPCHQVGPKKAIALAHEAVREWEKENGIL